MFKLNHKQILNQVQDDISFKYYNLLIEVIKTIKGLICQIELVEIYINRFFALL